MHHTTFSIHIQYTLHLPCIISVSQVNSMYGNIHCHTVHNAQQYHCAVQRHYDSAVYKTVAQGCLLLTHFTWYPLTPSLLATDNHCSAYHVILIYLWCICPCNLPASIASYDGQPAAYSACDSC